MDRRSTGLGWKGLRASAQGYVNPNQLRHQKKSRIWIQREVEGSRHALQSKGRRQGIYHTNQRTSRGSRHGYCLLSRRSSKGLSPSTSSITIIVLI